MTLNSSAIELSTFGLTCEMVYDIYRAINIRYFVCDDVWYIYIELSTFDLMCVMMYDIYRAINIRSFVCDDVWYIIWRTDIDLSALVGIGILYIYISYNKSYMFTPSVELFYIYIYKSIHFYLTLIFSVCHTYVWCQIS